MPIIPYLGSEFLHERAPLRQCRDPCERLRLGGRHLDKFTSKGMISKE